MFPGEHQPFEMKAKSKLSSKVVAHCVRLSPIQWSTFCSSQQAWKMEIPILKYCDQLDEEEIGDQREQENIMGRQNQRQRQVEGKGITLHHAIGLMCKSSAIERRYRKKLKSSVHLRKKQRERKRRQRNPQQQHCWTPQELVVSPCTITVVYLIDKKDARKILHLILAFSMLKLNRMQVLFRNNTQWVQHELQFNRKICTCLPE